MIGRRLQIAIASLRWSPSQLFAADEVGAWYDPSDLTTLFQNRTGTTPVTADGQTVGKILDKSGRGNHAVAPSDAARPIYKTDGTYHWLQFDGVDDALGTTAIDFTSTDKMSVFSGSRQNAVGSGGIVCSYLHLPGFATLFNNNILRNDFKDVARISGATSINTDYVFSTLFDASQATAPTQTKPRINGVAVNTVIDATTATGNQETYQILIGDWLGVMLNGRIYSAIVLGRLATTQEVTDVEAWINSKTGAF